MNASLTGLTLTIGLAGATSLAWGQVAAEKTAAPSLFPNSYANVSLRHYTNVAETDSDGSITPKLQVRPTVGSTFLDGKLDVSTTGYFDKKTQTTQITQNRQTANATLSAFSNGVVSINPYLDFALPHQGSATNIAVASYQTIGHSFSLPGGSLSVSGLMDAGASFSSREEEVTYTRPLDRAPADGFAVDGEEQATEEEVTIVKQDPDLYHDWYATISGAPVAVPGLSIAITALASNSYKPQYSENEAGELESKYLLSQSSWERLRLSYKVSDTVTLTNDLYNYQGGLFSSRPAATKLLNIAYVSYKLK